MRSSQRRSIPLHCTQYRSSDHKHPAAQTGPFTAPLNPLHRTACSAVLILGLLLSGFGIGLDSAHADQPNILWITCEDIGQHLGCFGDKHAVTPNLDALAEQGVRYPNTFSVSGVCAPSRSALITGMYPTSIGTQHMRSRAVLPPEIKCFTESLRQAGYYCTNNSKTDYNFKPSPEAWDENSPTAHWRNREDGQPFFAVLNLTTTHEANIRADRPTFQKLTERLHDEQRQNPKNLELPPYYPDTSAVRRDWARYYELITALDYEVGDILQQLEDDGLAENTIVFFFSDHGVGLPRAKRWLYDSGIQVPLIIRWPEQLDPGTDDDQLISFVDFAPTILSLAGVEIPDHIQGRPFLGDKAGSPRSFIYAARDRIDERYDIIRIVRDKQYKYVRNYEPFKPYAQFINTAEASPIMQEFRRLSDADMLEGPQKLFMRKAKPVEELYDLEKDPHEVQDVAMLPRYQDVLRRMREAHDAWVDDTIDTGMLPEPELNARAGTEGIYAVVRQSGRELPLDQLRELAGLCEGRDGNFSKLIAALEHDDPAIRYWGAVGLGARKASSKKAVKALTAALDDASPSVRIAAAQALCIVGEEEQALPVLISKLQHDDEAVRILAANALDAIGDKAESAASEMERALDDPNKYVVRLVNRALNQLLGTSNQVP